VFLVNAGVNYLITERLPALHRMSTSRDDNGDNDATLREEQL